MRDQGARRRALRHLYRMSEDEFNARMKEQGGRCAVCLSPPPLSGWLDVDHDHSCCSGTRSCGACTRGLLCRKCNRAIGGLKDDPILLRRAADYLEKPRAFLAA